MLTVAQMFLLRTCAALPFLPWMWSSAASTTAAFSTGLPPGARAPHQGGCSWLGARGDLLCVAERLHLIHSWILEKLLERRQNLRAENSPGQHPGEG